MDIKRHLGFDFTNDIDDVKNYYDGLGAVVNQDTQRSDITDEAGKEFAIRMVVFTDTPVFLSAKTSRINIGAMNGRIEMITILTSDLFASTTMDRKLHTFSRGNVSVKQTGGPKEIVWLFDNCRVIKRQVAGKDDSVRYLKYDIIPEVQDYKVSPPRNSD